MGNELLTRREVAQFFRLSLPTIHKYTQAGIFPAHHIGSRLRFKKDEIEQSLIKLQPQARKFGKKNSKQSR
jgi:excisionase family DNA binding protein